MAHEPNLKPETVEKILQSLENKEPDLQLMQKGKMAYDLFISEILNYNR
jgi:hypothetical protein